MKFSTLFIAFTCLFASATSFSQISISAASLRTVAPASTTQPYMITDAGREGIFYYDPRDLSTPDNGGTVIVNGTKRFKRMYSGSIDIRWFGAKGDYNSNGGTDNYAAVTAAINSARKFETVMIPDGQYYISGSVALPLTTVKKVRLEIFGDVYFRKGYGFIVEGAYQDFRSYGMICGLNTGATTEAAYAAYVGTGVFLKNAVNCNIEINEIKDFKYGIHLSGDKSGGTGVGCQYNKIHFNSIHHNYVQIKISTAGATTGGNWNNSSFFYGGQLGRGIPNVTFGQGGWYGISFVKDPSSNALDPMNGHVFNDIGYEGLEKAVILTYANNNSFMGGRIEPFGVRVAFDIDPNSMNNKIIGVSALDENLIAPGRVGNNTIINGTPIWGGSSTSKQFMGSEAAASSTPNKLLVTTSKFNYTNFMVNKIHDLISQTGQYPTLQAMVYRLNGVVRSVPFKKTFFYAKTSTAGSPLVLPPNIGLVRVETNQAKVFKIDTGDLAMYGEEFIVEYMTPQYPISFVRSDNGALLIPATQFNSGGTYRCLWADGVFKVSKLGAEYKTVTQDGPNWTVADGTETHYVNYQWATATVTLPPAAAWPGREIVIKNLQAGKNVQMVGVSGSDESIIQGRGAMTVKSDGSTWNVISVYKRNVTY